MQVLDLNVGITEMALAKNNEISNWGFLIFLFCFFINVFLIRKRLPLIFSMMDGLFHKKDRQSIFFIQGDHGFAGNFLMLIQTALISGIILYGFQRHFNPDFAGTVSELFFYVGIGALFFTGFFIYKYLTYNLIGFSFFSKEQNQFWNHQFISIFCLSGVFLFVPTLLLFFVNESFIFCIYFIILALFFVCIYAIYTIYSIFFQDKVPLLYFILYLCGQEIIPLYIIYWGFVYFL